MFDIDPLNNLDGFDPHDVNATSEDNKWDSDSEDTHENHDADDWDASSATLEGFTIGDDSDIYSPSFSSDDSAELSEYSHVHKQGASISFTGYGRCSVCDCGKWAGYGDICENCGHFYNKHY